MERKVKQTGLRLKTWNGSAMIPGLTYHLQGVHDARRTAVIVKELSRLQVDSIVSLFKRPGSQELALRKKEFILFWKGKSSNEKREHGVGFFGRKQLTRTYCLLEHNQKESPRLHSFFGSVSLISANAHTLISWPVTKDRFYIWWPQHHHRKYPRDWTTFLTQRLQCTLGLTVWIISELEKWTKLDNTWCSSLVAFASVSVTRISTWSLITEGAGDTLNQFFFYQTKVRYNTYNCALW